MSGAHKSQVILAFVLWLGHPITAQAQGPFADVPVGHWAYDPVNEMAALGVFTGFPDQTFRGHKEMTRYEITVAGQRLLQIFHNARYPRVPPVRLPAPVPTPGPPLVDVPPAHWAADAVEEMNRLGFLLGSPGNTFAGERAMTRYELAAFFYRTHEYHVQWVDRWIELVRTYRRQGNASDVAPPPSDPSPHAQGERRSFVDVPSDHWARPAVEALSSRGIILGAGTSRFHGEQVLTRYEFAAALQRLLAGLFHLREKLDAASIQRSDDERRPP